MKIDGRLSLRLLFAVLVMAKQLPSPAEDRPGTIDEILLVDKSLSMRAAMGDVKRFAAADLVGSILVPGDRLVIEAFYGKVERIYSGTIESEADKKEAIRRLESIVADGAYTDIGAALDAAGADLAGLGEPQRPKYVVLLTDERQEAPPGSPYASKDFRVHHPALTYTRRIDRGAYREIIVGLDVAAKVDSAAPGIMQLLDRPPARSEAVPAGTTSAGTTTAAPGGPAAAGAPGGNAGLGAPSSPAATQASGPASPGLGPLPPGPKAPPPLPFVPILIALFLAGSAGGALLFFRRRKHDRELHDS